MKLVIPTAFIKDIVITMVITMFIDFVFPTRRNLLIFFTNDFSIFHIINIFFIKA